MNTRLFVLLFLFLPGCWATVEGPSALQSSPVERRSISPEQFSGLDPGGGIPLRTLHFQIEGYGGIPQEKSRVVEQIYQKVMDKTALYSFKPKDNYRVVIYLSQDEFQRKTGQPDWSGGLNFKTQVYTFEQPGLDMVLAHEITHVIFREFMGEETLNYRWINEGLALQIDSNFHPQKSSQQLWAERLSNIRKERILTMSEIIDFKVYSESPEKVGFWYDTVGSLTGFLIENGGVFNFALFLGEIKNQTPMDRALYQAYPGKYRNLEELYSLWRVSSGL